ncbi:MAG: hypothetical protein QW186_07780 [Candidatus Bathyarchaeia archaeon]
MNRILEYVRAVEDWRGLIAFTFTLGFFIVFIIDVLLSKGFEGVKLLMPPVMLILGFYFGEKSAG